jgi:hypothetical protein
MSEDGGPERVIRIYLRGVPGADPRDFEDRLISAVAMLCEADGVEWDASSGPAEEEP